MMNCLQIALSANIVVCAILLVNAYFGIRQCNKMIRMTREIMEDLEKLKSMP